MYRFLHKEGHDVVLIYKSNYRIPLKEFIKKILLKVPFHNFKNIKTNNLSQTEWKKRKKFHRQFIEKEIFKISQDLYTKQNLENFAKKENFDVVIVGSDQVWRKAYIDDKYYKSYFIDGNKIGGFGKATFFFNIIFSLKN